MRVIIINNNINNSYNTKNKHQFPTVVTTIVLKSKVVMKNIKKAINK